MFLIEKKKKKGRLVVLYDDNKISIDGSTDITFTEDVLARFEAYGWHTLRVNDGDSDVDSIASAIETALSVCLFLYSFLFFSDFFPSNRCATSPV